MDNEDRLGWKPEPDSIRAVEFPIRFARFPMSADTPNVPLKDEISYRSPILDQIGPSCGGYSLRTKLDGAPVRTSRGPSGLEIYQIANGRDEWSPHPHDGTSTRAVMDVGVEYKLIDHYSWAQTFGEALRFLRSGNGMLLFGTWWHKSMFYPDKYGFIKPDGNKRGGHMYAVHRYSERLGACGIPQTWGRDWGVNGRALILAEHLEALWADNGECAAAIEIRRPR